MQLDAPRPAGTLRGILRVQNNEPNATVFSKQLNGDPFKVQFAAKGYPGDTQRVPVALAEDIDFINSLESGVLTIIDGPSDIVEGLQFETAQVREERQQMEQQHTAMLDRRQDRDIVGTTCIGPGPTGRDAKCNRSLIQSAKQGSEQPPLCSQHAHLSPNFFLAEAGSKGEDATESRDGVVRREWKTVTMAAPQRQV